MNLTLTGKLLADTTRVAARSSHIWSRIRQLAGVCKLRIGATIAFTALTGVAIAPGATLPPWQLALFGIAVLLSAAAAGGMNQYFERDLDARMRRTRSRPFVTGELKHEPVWLVALAAVMTASVVATALVTNLTAAMYVLLGGITYAVVYTVWLKRRTWMNIVIGGLAGSFALLAGATAVTPTPDALAWMLALVLFLWTPSHFWSLAIAMHSDYKAAGVPMLPVVIGDAAAARVIFTNSVLLVTASLAPVGFGLGHIYLLGAGIGGALLLYSNLRLLRDPTPRVAMQAFHASLVQLTLILTAAIVDVRW